VTQSIVDDTTSFPKKRKAYVTQFGNPINIHEMLDNLKVGQSFPVDDKKMRTYALSLGNKKGIILQSWKEQTWYRIGRPE
jgi:hypothetical protein